jgi:hypothetical protein
MPDPAPAVVPVNWDMFRSILENIKPYDGNSDTLNRFIKRCDDFINKYKQFNDPHINQHCFDCVQEKLIGRAELMVGRRAELDTWASVKTALIQCFSDRRNLDCLVQELTRTRPHKNEDLLEFGKRIQVLRSNVLQRVSNDPVLSANDKACHFNHYEKTALNTFIAGCSGNLRNNMYLKKPTCLEDAMSYVTEYENFEKLFKTPGENKPYGEVKQFQKFNNPMPNFSNQASNFNNPTQFNFRQPNNNFQHFQNQQRPFFPSAPINIQPRQVNPQRFPTNRQVFGPPKNVFKPNQIPQNQLPKPEPMSTTSRNPTINTNRNLNNYQRQHFQNFNRPIAQQYQRPNFTFEELYSNEYLETNDDPFTEYYDQNESYEIPENSYIDQNNYIDQDNQEIEPEPSANFLETGPDNPTT